MIRSPSHSCSFVLPHPLFNSHIRTYSTALKRPKPALQASLSPHVIIIGGGAAAHTAAISLNTHHPTRTTILESTPHVLQKVRISGGGRCNVTSANDAHDSRAFASHYPRGGAPLLSLLSTFGPQDVQSFFEALGVELKVEPGGKVFPVSNSSDTVIRALTQCAADCGVVTQTRARVIDLLANKTHDTAQAISPRYAVRLADGSQLHADYILIATGSARASHTWARQLGHTIVSPVPSLFTFTIRDSRLDQLAGLSVADAIVSLQVDNAKGVTGLSQRGPVLITHWGLSGPAILSLSAFGARVLHASRYKAVCTIDWLPTYSKQHKCDILRSARTRMGAKNVSTVSPFRELPKRLWRSLTRHHAHTQWASLPNSAVADIADLLHCSSFQIVGKGEFKDEFVTAGGVCLSGLHMSTFESKYSSGLYFAGEVLNVDGRTGGYNLEFAWSSGYIAGAAIADQIVNSKAEKEMRLLRPCEKGNEAMRR